MGDVALFPGSAQLSLSSLWDSFVTEGYECSLVSYYVIFAFSASYWPCPFIVAGLTEDEDVPWKSVWRCLPVWNSVILPSSDVRSSETSTQNARGKNFQKFTCSNFRSSYFRILVVGRESRENLDLARISRYTVCNWDKPEWVEWWIFSLILPLNQWKPVQSEH